MERMQIAQGLSLLVKAVNKTNELLEQQNAMLAEQNRLLATMPSHQ